VETELYEHVADHLSRLRPALADAVGQLYEGESLDH
jgi:hypothetical protein